MYWTRRQMLKTTALGLIGSSAIGWAESNPPKSQEVHPSLQDVPKIDENDRQNRIEKAQVLMTQHKLDALYISPGTSMLYFSAVNWGRSERPFAMILPKQGDPVFLCPAFEARRAQERIHPEYKIYTWEEHESPYKLVKTVLIEKGISTGRIGMEETVRFFESNGIAKAAPHCSITSGDPVIHGCRGIKSPKELMIIRAANQVTIQVYETTFSQLREGMNEDDTAKIVRDEFSKLGLQGGAFVLHGKNSAFPHGTKNKQPLRKGMIVLMDGGCRLQGYASDITRTTVFGKPNSEQLKVWDILRKTQDAALKAAKIGATCGDVDDAARKIINDNGYGSGYKYFSHRLGHGIGMDGHEYPYLVKGNPLPLEPGMTFSNEPGIYIYNKFGIRLEDIMYMDEHGAKFFTRQAVSLEHPFG